MIGSLLRSEIDLRRSGFQNGRGRIVVSRSWRLELLFIQSWHGPSGWDVQVLHWLVLTLWCRRKGTLIVISSGSGTLQGICIWSKGLYSISLWVAKLSNSRSLRSFLNVIRSWTWYILHKCFVLASESNNDWMNWLLCITCIEGLSPYEAEHFGYTPLDQVWEYLRL